MSDSRFVPPADPVTGSTTATRPNRNSTRSETLTEAQLLMSLALARKVDQDGTCAHEVNGVELVADPCGTVWWPQTRTLLVADLHLEKGSSFARRGQMLPPYDTLRTLQRLQASIDHWQPRRVIALGDSFHDDEAANRLPLPAKNALRDCMRGREWVWISGNHDPSAPESLGGDHDSKLREGGLILRHEPQVDDYQGEIAGHLHPKARLVIRSRHIRRSCFAVSPARMILPSFGAYTGGLNVLDRAFADLFEGRNFHALMRGEGQVFKIAGADLL